MKIIEKRIKNPIEETVINFGEAPVFNASDYEKRIAKLFELAGNKYSHIIIYGDREHFSNVEYLTGFDPRFEETVMIVPKDDIPTIVVGLEGVGYTPVIPYQIKTELYTSFGLPGQPRGKVKKLSDIFKDAGINNSSKVGFVGWKCFNGDDFADYDRRFEAPHFIMESLFDVVDRENVLNATDLFMSNEYGLRHDLDAKEIILAEIASTKTSRSVYRVIKNLREGITEMEASGYLCIDGEPLQCFPNVNFGQTNVGYGFASPTYHKKLELGENVGIGAAYRRSLCHKMFIYAGGEDDMGIYKGCIDYVFKPYFHSVINWYETLEDGVACGKIYDAAKEPLGSFKAFGAVLNPGHLIHTDEWSNSPFCENSQCKLRSGMLVQCDYAAFYPNPKLCLHAEDGIAVANVALRSEIAKMAPEAWKRIQARRKFMAEELGINLREEILPLSDIQGMQFVYAKDPLSVLAKG